MAFAWNAHYGYVLGTSSQAPNLEGMHFADLTFTDTDKLFIIPESEYQPVPYGTVSNVNLETALLRRGSLSEYYYATYIPHMPINRTEAQMTNLNVENAITALNELFPYALKYPLHLISRLKILAVGDKFYTTFVALKGRHRVITYQGEIFSFTDADDTLHKIWPSSGGSDTACFWADFSISDTACSIYCRGDYMPTDPNYDHLNPDKLYKYSWRATDQKTFNIFSDANTGQALTDSATFMNAIGLSTGDYDYRTDPKNPETDPYVPPFSPLNPSGPGGGEGTHDPEHDSDPAPIPDITQFTDIADTGLISVWNPTLSELGNLAKILWNDNFAAALYNFFNKPMDVIIGLSIVPLAVSGTPSVLKFGYINPGQYGVAMNQVDTQYYEVDCGGFNCDKIWGSYLDYQTRFQIYLPFIGFKPLQAEDVMGHELRVKYHVDIVTGSCIAYVLTDNFCTYTFAGNCSYQIPITEQGFENIVGSLIQTAGTIGAAIIAPEAAAGPAALAAAGSSLNTMGAKPTYQKSGGMGGNSAFMGMRTPFLISYVPRACVPANQNKIMGYPSYQTKQLNQVSGYTEVLEVHLNGIGATDTEKAEILAALKEGVIL